MPLSDSEAGVPQIPRVPQNNRVPQIRRARPEDAEWLARLRAARRGTLEESREWAHRCVRRSDAEPGVYALLVAGAVGEEPVAYGAALHFDPPADAPTNCAPAGAYLVGLVVHPEHRRCGIGRALVRARLDWIATRSDDAYYFADDDNAASVALHAQAGFVPVTTDFWFPGVGDPDSRMTLHRARLRGA